ncbi:MAG: class I SAM-dependent methyltransferase [Candidatus Nanoarchaeia archaeon]|nr:class I SAM-dependent methyltransferase [Candidatus Nanoarchaeia archaeon]
MNKQDGWNEIGENYNKNWEREPEKRLSKLELNFIILQLKEKNPKKILDMGCGTGRILHCLFKNSKANAKIYGLDYAQKMVDFCKRSFYPTGTRSKIKAIFQCDFSNEELPKNLTFDFISAIRVLKYNKNWREIIPKIKNTLNPDGVFVFTMPNKVSASFFSNYGIQDCLTTRSEVKKLLIDQGLLLENTCSFSRLPRTFYTFFNGSITYAKLILFIEKILGIFLGKTLFGKELFFVTRKPR